MRCVMVEESYLAGVAAHVSRFSFQHLVPPNKYQTQFCQLLLPLFLCLKLVSLDGVQQTSYDDAS